MNKFIKFFFGLQFGLYSCLSYSASLEEQVKGGQAVVALCKGYADKMGRDSSHFSDLNMQTLKIAEKLGYTDDFDKYQNEVSGLQSLLNEKLMAQYGSIEAIYFDWCKKFYVGIIERAQGRH